MKPTTSLAVLLPLLALTACFTSTTSNTGQSSVPSISSAAMQETKNVTYQGTVLAAGASIFMEGTHKLQLEDGRFIMLQSTAVDLDAYLNQKVELLGAVRPTTEAGGMIMRVENIASREPSSSSVMSMTASSSSLSSVASSSALSSAAAAASVTAQSSKSAVASSTIAASSAAPVVSSAAVVTPQSSSAAFEASTELTEKAAIMAKDNMAPSLWTQRYCTKTAAYCVAVHKNWYFTSFGATSTTLWHVEVGPQEINNIGEGPLSVNLVSGSTSMDGQVKAEAGGVVGYKEWTNNRHFEIRGPSNLQTAISYMLTTLVANDQ